MDRDPIEEELASLPPHERRLAEYRLQTVLEILHRADMRVLKKWIEENPPGNSRKSARGPAGEARRPRVSSEKLQRLRAMEQRVLFVEWAKWAERTSLDDIDSPGVYLLAHFKNPPDGAADPSDHRIIYIGETCDNALRGRWRQFHRSAFQGKSGHSGGETYRETFGDRGDQLYVAAFAINDLDEDVCHIFIRYLERKLLWEFALKWGSAPACNRK